MREPSYDFSGRRVLVTGGTRGMGLFVAHAFADAGAQVTVTGDQYLRAYYDADLSRFGYDQLRLMDRDSIAAVAGRVGPLDILVNHAPPVMPTDADTTERQFIGHAVQLGLVGPFAFTHRLRYRLGQSTMRGGGVVVNMPSTEEWLRLAHAEHARHELAGRTRRLASEWASAGVRVNSVTAHLVEPQRAGLRVQIDRSSGPLLTRTRSAPTGTTRDVGNAVLFLASNGAAAIRGQTFHVDAWQANGG
ncbi:SDR family NAD(P)-dependent oxidoreductase [Nocardioides sp.]|uniref:SDR family NAD(P)-dependent oxidoreductase n=1 Tax=Nocardioides sp. TaxID=35761 RepID=UPI002D8019C3|nr:SDR family oxidoreductase [Nocardioides sp.]HET8962232.1 SDR family oxidoreductase [Nocardioides sp.]